MDGMDRIHSLVFDEYAFINQEIGQTLSHFRIVEKIGQGGKGTVSLAGDLTPDREVMLKVLPVTR